MRDSSGHPRARREEPVRQPARVRVGAKGVVLQELPHGGVGVRGDRVPTPVIADRREVTVSVQRTPVQLAGVLEADDHHIRGHRVGLCIW